MQISLDHLTKAYGGVTALDDVSLEIAPGQIVAIVGANGAGKTTLLRSLAGLAAPTQGEIRYDGQPFNRSRVDLRRRFAFLPDTPCVYPQMTVLRHIGMALRLYGAERPGIEDTVASLLRQFDLLPLAESPLCTLSRGELYKAALVAVLAVDPEVWMFDEPFASGMDPHGLTAFRHLSREAASRGRTVLYSTQILELAERFADAVCVLYRGQLRAFGPVASLRQPNGDADNVLEALLPSFAWETAEMSAHSLHKAMRDRVRQELRSSPSLWKEYVRRRWAARKHWWLIVPLQWLMVPCAIIMSIIIGCVASFQVLVFTAPPRQLPMVATPQSVSLWSLVALNIGLTGFCVAVASGFSEQVWRSRELAVLVHFPVEDRRLLIRQLAIHVGGSMFAVLTIATVLGTIAHLHSSLSTNWPLVAVFSLCEWLVAAATAILLSAHVRWRLPNELVGLGGFLVAIFAAMSGGALMFLNISPAVGCALFALSPPGWVHAAFYFGVIEGAMAGFLFLLPAAVVVGLAIRWVKGTFNIRDVGLFDGRATLAAIAGTARLAAPRFFDQRRRTMTRDVRNQSEQTRAAPFTTPVVGDQFLRKLDWAQLGWIERFVSARLTKRQRLLLESDNPGPLYWTRFWVASFVIGGGAALTVYSPGIGKERQVGEFLAGFLNVASLGAAMLSPMRDGAGQHAWHAYFPVGFRELSGAYFVQAILRSALTVPILLALNIVGALLGGNSTSAAAVGVAASWLVAFGWYLFARCHAASSSTNDTANRWIFAGWLTVIVILGSLSFVSVAPFGMLRPFSAAAALLVAWAGWRKYAWLLDHGDIDIVR